MAAPVATVFSISFTFLSFLSSLIRFASKCMACQDLSYTSHCPSTLLFPLRWMATSGDFAAIIPWKTLFVTFFCFLVQGVYSKGKEVSPRRAICFPEASKNNFTTIASRKKCCVQESKQQVIKVSQSVDPDQLKKPTDIDQHCLSVSIWTGINNPDKVIWLAET